jgi:hypothetical protein
LVQGREEIDQTSLAPAATGEDSRDKNSKASRKEAKKRKQRKTTTGQEEDKELEPAQPQALEPTETQVHEQEAEDGSWHGEGEEKEEVGGQDKGECEEDKRFEADFFSYLFKCSDKEKSARKETLNSKDAHVNWRALHMAVMEKGEEGGTAAPTSSAGWRQAYTRYCERLGLDHSPKANNSRWAKKMKKLYNTSVQEYAVSLVKALADAERELGEDSDVNGEDMDCTKGDDDVQDFNQVCARKHTSTRILAQISLRFVFHS